MKGGDAATVAAGDAETIDAAAAAGDAELLPELLQPDEGRCEETHSIDVHIAPAEDHQ